MLIVHAMFLNPPHSSSFGFSHHPFEPMDSTCPETRARVRYRGKRYIITVPPTQAVPPKQFHNNFALVVAFLHCQPEIRNATFTPEDFDRLVYSLRVSFLPRPGAKQWLIPEQKLQLVRGRTTRWRPAAVSQENFFLGTFHFPRRKYQYATKHSAREMIALLSSPADIVLRHCSYQNLHWPCFVSVERLHFFENFQSVLSRTAVFQGSLLAASDFQQLCSNITKVCTTRTGPTVPWKGHHGEQEWQCDVPFDKLVNAAELNHFLQTLSFDSATAMANAFDRCVPYPAREWVFRSLTEDARMEAISTACAQTGRAPRPYPTDDPSTEGRCPLCAACFSTQAERIQHLRASHSLGDRRSMLLAIHGHAWPDAVTPATLYSHLKQYHRDFESKMVPSSCCAICSCSISSSVRATLDLRGGGATLETLHACFSAQLYLQNWQKQFESETPPNFEGLSWDALSQHSFPVPIELRNMHPHVSSSLHGDIFYFLFLLRQAFFDFITILFLRSSPFRGRLDFVFSNCNDERRLVDLCGQCCLPIDSPVLPSLSS